MTRFVDGENRYKRRLVESKSVGLITSRLHIEGVTVDVGG